MSAADVGLPSTFDSRARQLAARVSATPLIPVIVAVVLGTIGIGDKSIWVDEGIAFAMARMPIRAMLDYIARQELVASPYFLALKPWLALGESEAAIRLLAVVFGALAVVGTWLVAKRYGVAFRAALLMAVLPTLVVYMQQVKGYTLIAAVSAFSTWLVLRLIDRPSPWRAIAYVGSAILIAYVNPLAALIPIAHIGFVFATAAHGDRRRLLLLFVPIFIGWIPVVVFAIRSGDKWAWIPPATPDVVASELVALGGGLLVAIVLGVALLFGIRRDVMALWLLVPLAGALLASVLIEPVFRHAYLIGVLPAAAIIAARAPRVVVATLIVVALVANVSWYQAPSSEDWRGAAGYLAAQVQDGDGLVFAPAYVRPAFGYYARIGEPLLPSMPWSASDVPYSAAPNDNALRVAARIWLIKSDQHYPTVPDNVAAEIARRPVLSERDFGGEIRVILLGPDASGDRAATAATLAGQ